uniref:NTP transferase domain-containing protein n=1 Tax=Cumulibacter manganitolerans TaxID=1884992 RepID=UPI001296F0A6
MSDTAPYDAIILAGGRGSRLGGVDKAQVDLAGAPLIDRPLAACATARRVVVVGPPSAVAHLRGSQERYAPDSVTGSPADRVQVTREQPPGGGPAAATAAGLAALD